MSYSNLLAGRMLGVLALFPVLFLTHSAVGKTILVPQNHATIQAAINAAAAGDVVIVGPGVYTGPGNRNLDLMGKRITLRSAGGAATCTIDSTDPTGAPHCGFFIQRAETRDTVIDGFTIRGGYQFNGGGIFVSGASPTVRNCIITGNRAACWGAGVYSGSSNASPHFLNCYVVDNISDAEGGGFFSISSPLRVENCVIAGNSGNIGGGTCVFGGSALFVNCRVTGNTATSSGGGMYLWSGQMVNCTVADNSAGNQGSAVFFGSGATIANSIVWQNTGAGQIDGTGTVTYSIVQGGMAGVGNLAADPRFVNPLSGDYRARLNSPAIDAASNILVPANVTRDLAGNARFADYPTIPDSGNGSSPMVDIGAFELNPKVRPVDVR